MSELEILRLPRGEVAVQGAHALRWQAADRRPVLFVSSRSRFAAGTPIRGGVPIVFPWFGDDPERRGRPAHGFARRLPWRRLPAGTDLDGGRAAFELVDDEATRALWPHAFRAELQLDFGRELQLQLQVENRGRAPFRFEALFHTYLQVDDVRAVEVRGLGGARYFDKLQGGRAAEQRDEVIRFGGEIDRTYCGTAATCVVTDPGLQRSLAVHKENAPSTVVWNPWIEKTARLNDLGADEWQRFVCVESGCVGDDAVTLAPGAVHRSGLRVECLG